MKVLILAIALTIVAPVGHAQLLEGGRPVPSLSSFDDAMQNYMALLNIPSGVLGVMRNGRIIYLRSFGSRYSGIGSLPENALLRIASLSKPITAAAVRRLIANGAFGLDDNVFDLGQAGGGLLDYDPFPFLLDNRLPTITVDHLLRHRGGWDRSDETGIGEDWTYKERDIADDMDVSSPPGRVNTVRWILGQPLQFTPGTDTQYSNIGMLSLGLVVEQESGQTLVDYFHQNILTPNAWVPSTELIRGRTFRAQQDSREPAYYSEDIVSSVFDSEPGLVFRPYGGWDHEARIGQGGYVTTAATMLEFLERYHVGTMATDIGQPVGSAFPRSNGSHDGSLDGTNTFMVQRADSINVFIAFNRQDDREDSSFGAEFYTAFLLPAINAVTTWPTATSDGFWVNLDGRGNTGTGGYADVFANMTTALAYVQDGSKLRLKAGSSAWTGVLSTKLLLDAPLGNAVIGN